MEAAEPEDRAWEEKWVEEKSGERKREKIGSVEKLARGLVVVVLVVAVESREDGLWSLSLKVESLWSGDEDDGGEREDLWIAAEEAIVVLLLRNVEKLQVNCSHLQI